MSVYMQMMNVAVAKSLPCSYKNDLLVHDKRLLDEHPGRAFYWLLDDCGTHLVWAEPPKSECVSHEHKFSSKHTHATINTIVDCFTRGRSPLADGSQPFKWFYCDGENLTPFLEAEIIERSKPKCFACGQQKQQATII